MKPFRWLTLAAFAAALIPRLAHEGMFVDGVTYAAIARNLAEGRGSFWSPHYTATLYPSFHEHPPLGFWLQSWWFRVFGDHLFVERAYALAAALVSAWLIVLVWRTLNGPAAAGYYRSSDASTVVGSGLSRTVGDLDWLPVAIWIAVPVVSWAVVGNLLETTVTVFALAAVLFVLRAGRADTINRSIVWASLSGVCVAAATLTKGPVGLFPLVAPLVCGALPEQRHTSIILTFQWLTLGACALVLALMPDARTHLTLYFNEQVIAAVAGTREVGDGSFTILRELLQGVLLPILIVGALSMVWTRRFIRPEARQRTFGVCSLLLGLAGSIPMLVSAKQAGHYLVPAVPFFALAGAAMLGPTIETIAATLTPRLTFALVLLSATIGIGTVAAAFSPAVGRDRVRMANLDALQDVVPRGVTIGICPESNGDWGLHAWFERRFHTSLDAASGSDRQWFLKSGREGSACEPARCRAVTDLRRDLIMMQCTKP